MTIFDNLPLPAELRNRIYEQLLHRCHPQRTRTALPLFKVSKQVSQESTSYFHQHNAFAITAASPTNDSATILPPIADKWLRYLRRLAVYVTTAGANSEREQKIASTITSFELNSNTTADGEESKVDANESSFFAGVDIEEWEASTQAAEQEEPQGQAEIKLDEDGDEDEDDDMEEVSQEEIDVIMGNMEDAAHHIVNEKDLSYMTNFAPHLLLSRHNLGHLD